MRLKLNFKYFDEFRASKHVRHRFVSSAIQTVGRLATRFGGALFINDVGSAVEKKFGRRGLRDHSCISIPVLLQVRQPVVRDTVTFTRTVSCKADLK